MTVIIDRPGCSEKYKKLISGGHFLLTFISLERKFYQGYDIAELRPINIILGY